MPPTRRPPAPAPAPAPQQPITFNSVSYRKKEQSKKQSGSPRSASQSSDRLEKSHSEPAILTPSHNSEHFIKENTIDSLTTDDSSVNGGSEEYYDRTKSTGLSHSELLPGEHYDDRSVSPAWEQISLPGSENDDTKSEKSDKSGRSSKEKSTDVSVPNGISEDLEKKSELDLIDMLLDTVSQNSRIFLMLFF